MWGILVKLCHFCAKISLILDFDVIYKIKRCSSRCKIFFLDKQYETCQKNSGSEESIDLITKNQKIYNNILCGEF